MIFKPAYLDNILVGEYFEHDGFIYFFGNKNSNLDSLRRLYPKITFRALKQIHSDAVVDSSAGDTPLEADAHYTKSFNVGILIYTADCLPILGSTQDYAFAIHAGWRGVFSDIVGNTLKLLPQNAPLYLCIGPHIQEQSFEVDLFLADKFHAQWRQKYGISQAFGFQPNPNRNAKFYLNLQALVKTQVEYHRFEYTKITTSTVDTLTNSNYSSYRRDGKSSGRNISFVARLN
jgi:YfiH family protein